MNIKQFKKLSSSDQVVEQLSLRVSEFCTQLEPNPTLVGQRIVNVSVSAVPKTIAHNLGKAFIGWQVIRNRANIVVYEGVQKTPENFLTLVASGTGIIDLWIF